MLTAPLFSSS
jgi:tetratricopeptide (TPR) repeat protein